MKIFLLIFVFCLFICCNQQTEKKNHNSKGKTEVKKDDFPLDSLSSLQKKVHAEILKIETEYWRTKDDAERDRIETQFRERISKLISKSAKDKYLLEKFYIKVDRIRTFPGENGKYNLRVRLKDRFIEYNMEISSESPEKLYETPLYKEVAQLKEGENKKINMWYLADASMDINSQDRYQFEVVLLPDNYQKFKKKK